jgi:anion-transporting  ArsA/GET3 family ATPase
VSLASLLAAKEVVVCCGSGGVGKTTIAAATAIGAVEHVGGRVLVLTVDPARRLATALGVRELGNVARRVPDDVLKLAGVESRGELYAAMLDTKQSWDELVLRHAADEAAAYRILDNRLYHNLTARFVQSHDYIAMERLYELHTSGEYDLIVVDTPPTRNAIDFLDAPARMADFFGGRLLRWLTLPYRVGGRRGTRVLDVASRPFYSLADRLLGSHFLEEIAEFFLNFQSMYDGFVTRAASVEALLADRRTTFALVTTLEDAPWREADRFRSELTRRELPVGALVLNKTMPDYLLDPVASETARVFRDESEAIAIELETLAGDVARAARVLRTIADSFRNFAVVAAREAELRAEISRSGRKTATTTVRVPSRESDVADLAGLAWIAQHLFASESPTASVA